MEAVSSAAPTAHAGTSGGATRTDHGTDEVEMVFSEKYAPSIGGWALCERPKDKEMERTMKVSAVHQQENQATGEEFRERMTIKMGQCITRLEDEQCEAVKRKTFEMGVGLGGGKRCEWHDLGREMPLVLRDMHIENYKIHSGLNLQLV